MELKQIAVVLGALGALFLGHFARGRPRTRALLALSIGGALFVPLPDVSLGFVEYRGADSGFLVTLVDLLALSLAVALPGKGQRMPYRGAVLLYLGACLLSITSAQLPTYSWFSIWTLLRVCLLLRVVTLACAEVAVVRALIRGIALGLVYAAALGLKQRYVDGYHQVAGAYDHQNALGMAVNTVVPLMFVLMLRERNRLATAAVVAGALCVVLTLSRGALAMLIAGLGITYLGSVYLHGLTRRKAWLAWGGVTCAIAVLAKSTDSIVRRIQEAPAESLETRELLNEAARQMLADHPFRGVGLNMYPHVLDKGGYAETVGLATDSVDAVAHHIYWLTLAEVGPVGLLGYLLLISLPMLAAFRVARRFRGQVRADLALGCLVGMLTMHVHGLYEWNARQAVQAYLFAIVAGLAAGLARHPAFVGRGNRTPRADSARSPSARSTTLPATSLRKSHRRRCSSQ